MVVKHARIQRKEDCGFRLLCIARQAHCLIANAHFTAPTSLGGGDHYWSHLLMKKQGRPREVTCPRSTQLGSESRQSGSCFGILTTSLASPITFALPTLFKSYLLSDKIVRTSSIFRMNIENVIYPWLIGEWPLGAVSVAHSVFYPRRWCVQTLFVSVNIKHHINIDSAAEPE